MTVTVIGTAQGSTEGGTAVTLVSTALNVGACQPNLTDGVLDGWTNFSAGGGTVIERAADAAIILDTGPTAGGVAGVRRTATDSNVDVEIGAVVLEQQGQAAIGLEFGFFIDANNDFRLLWQNGALTARIRIGGVTRLDTPAGTTGSGLIGGGGGFIGVRLLRASGQVHVLLGGQELTVLPWVTTAAQVEIVARNTNARVVTRISSYIRRPVVMFGGVPTLTVINHMSANNRATVTSPVGAQPGFVDIDVFGCAGATDSALDGFEYIGPGGLRVGTNFTVLNDSALKQ